MDFYFTSVQNKIDYLHILWNNIAPENFADI